MAGGITQTKAITLEFEVYLHTSVLTAEPAQGIEVFPILMILGHDKGWRIDCLDMGNLNKRMPRNQRDTLEPVVRKAAELIQARGVNPAQVRGWRRWFPDYVVNKVWHGMGV